MLVIETYRIALIGAAVLALGACSNAQDAAKAPTGAMENFADRHDAEEAGKKEASVEAARAREAGRAADARQKVQAAEGIDRFERTERAMEADAANNAR